MIQLIVKILFNLFVFVVWPIQLIWHEFLMSKKRKKRQELAALISQISHRILWDRDLLDAAQLNKLQSIKSKAIKLQNEKSDSVDKFLLTATSELNKAIPHARSPVKEWLELFIVVFGVVMGARALFLQPFKIPTGSMQPTLFGINFTETNTKDFSAGVLKRVFDYVNYSYRYTDIVIEEDGYLENIVTKNPLFFFPYSRVKIGNKSYKVPGDKNKVLRYLGEYRAKYYPDENPRFFTKGQRLVQGYLVLGDHLFVDRLRLNFAEPQRGDITVFVTDGISNLQGDPLRGRYYIKRLVGLPGDELRITNRKLYVKEKGNTEFMLVDQPTHPAFGRMYSYKGGYKGYSHANHPMCQYLKNNTDVFTLENDQYFMLGDNSENSQDSRFWGIVPRENIVGRANLVYWPFSRRWGFTDHVEPENFESRPTKEIID